MLVSEEARRRFFEIVSAVQLGEIPPTEVTPAIRRVANTISPEQANQYSKAGRANLKELLQSIALSPKYTEQLIREARYSPTPIKIKGKYIDNYTGKLLTLALDNLTEQNKASLLQSSIDEMIAVSYKIITH